EGLDLELVDDTGKVIATTRTDFDGFFLFERVAYGRYTVRVARESAVVAKISAELGASADVTPEKSIVRLGAIRVSPVAVAVAAGATTPGSP
ncbi:MAG TPA: SdrD B-like domain-containing protein, partial [Sphingomicrobium sp.]|nr:SdrD B-like domain-containing protein [Sphingomicrobium sp.]